MGAALSAVITIVQRIHVTRTLGLQNASMDVIQDGGAQLKGMKLTVQSNALITTVYIIHVTKTLGIQIVKMVANQVGGAL